MADEAVLVHSFLYLAPKWNVFVEYVINLGEVINKIEFMQNNRIARLNGI